MNPTNLSKQSISQLPQFDNTEQAFAHLNSNQLRKAYWLFKTVGNPLLVKVGKLMMNIALALRIPVAWAIRPTVYAHFCGGETIDGCEKTIHSLHQNGVSTILDYSAEGKENERELNGTFEEIARAIDSTHGDSRHAFSVFKVSGIASSVLLEKVATQLVHNPDLQSNSLQLNSEDESAWNRVHSRVASLCSKAAQCGTPIFIDAEETWLQPAIDALALEAMRLHNLEKAIVFNTVQLYRTDRIEYLKALTNIAKEAGFRVGVKLVRGAYMEKERTRAAEKGYASPIQPSKAATDRDFNAAMRWCLDHIDRVSFCAGSHNEESNALLCKWMQEAKISPSDDRIWFAQLLGMSDPISFNLSAHEYRVAKYVPYGPIQETIPYLIRRAEENTSVAGQTSRELELIQREVKRRKAN